MNELEVLTPVSVISSLTVFYDARCGFCARCRDWLSKQPQIIPLHFLALQSVRVQNDFPELQIGDVASADLVVRDNLGGWYTGPEAFIMVLYACHNYRGWSMSLSQDSLKPLARLFFRNLSKNRRHISSLFGLKPNRTANTSPSSKDYYCSTGGCEIEDTSLVRDRGCAQICSYCRDCLSEGLFLVCAGCETSLHESCFGELGHCPTVGCAEAPMLGLRKQTANVTGVRYFLALSVVLILAFGVQLPFMVEPVAADALSIKFYMLCCLFPLLLVPFLSQCLVSSIAEVSGSD
jgi:predicted DCC family thiol-disulfide oxidoreductase YuxK